MGLHNIQLPSRVLSNWISPILKRSSAASIGPFSGILFQYLSWLVNSRWNVPIGGMGAGRQSHSKIISIKENKQLVSSERDSVIRE
jgi:hypothetical protein